MSRYYLYQAVRIKWVHRPENEHKVGTEAIIDAIVPDFWQFDDGDAYRLAGHHAEGFSGWYVASQLEPIQYTPSPDEEIEEEEPIVEYAYVQDPSLTLGDSY